jgi:hypothetical protein
MSTTDVKAVDHGPTVGKAIRDLLPLAVALIVFTAVEWLLLAQGWLLGTLVLAAFLTFHGLIHLMFLNPKPPETASGRDYPFDPARSG